MFICDRHVPIHDVLDQRARDWKKKQLRETNERETISHILNEINQKDMTSKVVPIILYDYQPQWRWSLWHRIEYNSPFLSFFLSFALNKCETKIHKRHTAQCPTMAIVRVETFVNDSFCLLGNLLISIQELASCLHSWRFIFCASCVCVYVRCLSAYASKWTGLLTFDDIII